MTVTPFNGIDRCVFNATSSGTGDFVVASAVRGYQTPAAAAAVNGEVYSYAAQSADLGQWEVGQGAYTAGSTTLARTTVLFNSLGTTAKINFSSPPQVLLSIAAEDINNLTINQAIIGAGADYTLDAGRLILEDTFRTLQSSAYWGADALGCRHWWLKSRGTTLNSHVAVQADDDVAALYFGGSDGTAWQQAAHIRASCDGTVASLSVPGRLSFWTTAASTQFPVERARLDSFGRFTVGSEGNVWNAGNATLQVQQIAGQWGLTVVANSASTASINLSATRNADYGGSTILQINDRIGNIELLGDDGVGFRTAARICVEVDATPGAGDMPGRLMFFTTPDGSTTAVERLRISNTGNANIGNAGATVNNVLGGLPKLQISSTGDALDLRRYSADSAGVMLHSAKSRNATLLTNTAVQSGDNLLVIIAGGFDATGTPVLQQSTAIISQVDAAPTAGSVAGRIMFSTCASGSGSPTERMRITSQGQAWIGNPTAVPSAGGTVGTTAMALQFGSGADFGIFVGSGVPTVAAATGSIYLRTDGSSTTTRLYVRTNSSTWATFTASA